MSRIKAGNVKGKNKFCGPAAMSSVFGITTDQAARGIREIVHASCIKGVYDHWLEQYMNKNNINFNYTDYSSSERIDNEEMTFSHFLNENKSGVFILCGGHHYVVIDFNQRRVWDNGSWASKKKPLLISEFEEKKGFVTVESYFEIISGVIPKEKKKVTKTSKGEILTFKTLFERYASGDAVYLVEDRIECFTQDQEYEGKEHTDRQLYLTLIDIELCHYKSHLLNRVLNPCDMSTEQLEALCIQCILDNEIDNRLTYSDIRGMNLMLGRNKHLDEFRKLKQKLEDI